jgi:hypothetical protein
MKVPNFIIIGAGRAGTTSLYHYLKQHPQVFMTPIKEPNFFAIDEEDRLDDLTLKFGREKIFPIKHINEYESLFQGVTKEKAAGEASPRYFWGSGCPARIKYHNPDIKLIAILRQPVERAYSDYLRYVQLGLETRPFTQAINIDSLQRRNMDHINLGFYLYTGFYYMHLKRYLAHFQRDQIAVYLFDDFERDALGVLRNIFQFLEVDDKFRADVSIKYNASGIPKYKLIDSALRSNYLTSQAKMYIPRGLLSIPYRLLINAKSRNLVKPALDPKLGKKLNSIYEEDVLRAQELIQRDLSTWMVM